MHERKPKIRVEDLVVIFGKSPEREALPMVRQGVSKNEVLEKTGHIVGVANVNFSIAEGELFVVMGLSGSGKSTLIRCLNRLIQPTAGKVLIDGDDVLRVSQRRLRTIRRTRMAMVFQHFALLPHQNVIDNVAYPLKIQGVDEGERHSRALEALNLVGLKPWSEHYLENLSGGMKQRVGLARALATDADILLMDEAFGALDPLIRREMQNELLQLQEELHKTIVFITHDLNEALRMGDQVAIMKEGRIVQIGTPVEISTSPADEYVAAFIQDIDQSRVLTAEVVMRQADYLVLGRDTVKTAIQRIKTKGDMHLYVVDQNHKLVGFLSEQGLLSAEEHHAHAQDLKRYIEHDIPQAGAITPLNELYPLMTDNMPIAVTDEQGCLIGTVHSSDIISNLAMVERIGESVNARKVTGMDVEEEEEEEYETSNNAH